MKATSLRELMGRPAKKSSFDSVEEYNTYLKSLNKAKLQDLCMEKGLMPSHDRRMLLRALEKQFKKEQAGRVRVSDTKPMSKDKQAAVLKALRN